MRLRYLLASSVVLAAAACSSTPAKPDHASVSPISKPDLAKVVSVICQEPTAGIAHVIDGIQNASQARMKLVIGAMEATCPDRLSDLNAFNDARLN